MCVEILIVYCIALYFISVPVVLFCFVLCTYCPFVIISIKLYNYRNLVYCYTCIYVGKKSDTFVACIDFSKAYDRINRQLLWCKLSRLGISDQFIHVLKSLYSKVQCTAKINGFVTDWFNVSVGLKQGCILSPVLFNAFMDDLVQMIREQKKGVKYGDLNVLILLYADDIVLLSNCEEGLQSMSVMLGEWCSKWGLTINGNKSKVMHFRSQSVDKTVFHSHVEMKHWRL